MGTRSRIHGTCVQWCRHADTLPLPCHLSAVLQALNVRSVDANQRLEDLRPLLELAAGEGGVEGTQLSPEMVVQGVLQVRAAAQGVGGSSCACCLHQGRARGSKGVTGGWGWWVGARGEVLMLCSTA